MGVECHDDGWSGLRGSKDHYFDGPPFSSWNPKPLRLSSCEKTPGDFHVSNEKYALSA